MTSQLAHRESSRTGVPLTLAMHNLRSHPAAAGSKFQIPAERRTTGEALRAWIGDAESAIGFLVALSGSQILRSSGRHLERR